GEEDSGVVIKGDGAAGTVQHFDPPLPLAEHPAPEPSPDRKPHWEVGEATGLIDFDRGAKLSGSSFYILKGDGARLQRALIAWFLDVHRQQAYQEVYPPFLVRTDMLVGTGQLPKFAEIMFHAEDTDL